MPHSPKFVLGKRSRGRLIGVHADLQRVVYRAISLTEVDFTVLEGMRSVERQRKLVASGASRTMRSRHITGHAVDLAAWVDGGVAWDWPLYFEIAFAMQRASTLEQVPIRWGGAWMRLDAERGPLEKLYLPVTMHRDYLKNGGTFPDGPHFELPVRLYRGRA